MRSLASRIVTLKERDRASTPAPVLEDDSDEEYIQRPVARGKRKLQRGGWADKDDRMPTKRLKTISE